MRTCVSHQTALAYLLRMPNLRDADARPSRASAIPDSVPSAAEAQALLEALVPNLVEGADALDVLVSTNSGRHQTKGLRARLCTTKLPAGSFIPADAMGIEFYLCAPELVFLQMASEVELDHLIYVGFALCSSFRLDEYAPGGCALREWSDAPLTSVARIRSYLERVPAGTKGRGAALRALEHVRDGARSPYEIGLAMVIGMPLRLGGYALGETVMNPEVKVYDGVDVRGQVRWVTRIPDILVSARDSNGVLRRVGVDYDAKLTHGAPDRVARDLDRRNLLAPNEDFRHITLGTQQVSNYVAFRREMDRIRRALGQRKKPRLVGDPDSERNRRLEADTLARQFDLWDRVLGGSRYQL